MLLCQLVARFTISLIQFLRLITLKYLNKTKFLVLFMFVSINLHNGILLIICFVQMNFYSGYGMNKNFLLLNLSRRSMTVVVYLAIVEACVIVAPHFS